VTVERDAQLQKQRLPRVSTDEGMQIDESDEHFQNAPFSITESREPGSSVTVERDSHPAKHFVQSFSVLDGMQIDESDVHDAKAIFSMHER
jgi:hypothetical protein